MTRHKILIAVELVVETNATSDDRGLGLASMFAHDLLNRAMSERSDYVQRISSSQKVVVLPDIVPALVGSNGAGAT